MMKPLLFVIRCFLLTVLGFVTTIAAAQNCSVTITNVSNPQCFGGCNGMATAVGSGTAPFAYSWMPSAQTTATANSLCAGTYTVTMFDAAGCTATATVTITQPPQLASATSTGGNDSICPGSCTMIVGTATGGTQPYTYSWSPATGLSTTTGTLTTACPSSTTTYTMTTIDANNCTTTSSSTITVLPGALAAACCNSTICTGGSVTLNATGNGGPPVWTPATGLSTTTGYTVVASPSATTTYTVTLTNSFGCSDTATVTVTVDPCVGIDEQQVAEINVSPNPFSDALNIECEHVIEQAMVFDIRGKAIITIANVNSGKLALSLEGKPPGVYMLKLFTTKGEMIQKIVKQE